MGLKKTICKIGDACADVPVIGGILKPKERVAVIRMSGVIADSSMKRGGISHAKYAKVIEAAFDTYNLKAVVIILNSPGGSPAQSALIGDHLRRLADEKDIPLYAFVEDVAASGGYWLACAADAIYAVNVSIVGSIGVISSSFGFKDLMERYGVERRVHTSGKDKGFLDPFMEEKPADIKRLKALQGELHESFIDWVKARRGDHLKADDKVLFEGAFWSAEKALELGLIDGLGEAKSMMREKFGEDIKFSEFGPEKGLVSGLIGGGEAKMNLARDFSDVMDERTHWARFGL
jgi:serine protease SohB